MSQDCWSIDHSMNRIGFMFYFQLLILFSSSSFSLIQTASFYGQSYIKLPFREFNNQTNIEFNFKTHQPNAFLILAAGSSDYILLYLEYGQLAVKINFGSGETYLVSDGLALNDLHWHHVQLEKINSHILLKIDEKKTYMSKINGALENTNLELKILYGIFLGSQNSFKGLYLGDLKPLRGCLDQIYFNKKNILNLAIKQAIFHEVSLEKCDEEFNSNNDNTTISFVHHDSFVLLPDLQHYYLPSKNITTPLIFQFDLKSISKNAIILFNPGKNPYKKEYLVLEIIKNRLKASINNGTNENHIYSSVSIYDSHWHHVELVFESNGQLVISVDGRRETSSMNGVQLPLQKLSNKLFLGGISSEKQSLAVNYGIESSLIEQNVSLKGCIKNIKINFKLTSLQDAIATKRILIGKCRWQFLCFDQDKSPCIAKSQCIQKEISRIKCSCTHQSDCVKKNFKHKSITVESERLTENEQCEQERSTEIDVMEGSSTVINKNLLQVINDEFSQNHTFDFFLMKKPLYGSLNIIDVHFDSNTLLTKNIRYTHITQEKHDDRIMLKLHRRFKAESPKLNEHEKCQYLLKISFKIHFQNDAPDRQTVHIKILENSKFTLTPSLFKLEQKETKQNKKKKDEMKFKVIKINNSYGSFFEKINEPLVKLENFSENEIKNESIRFVHQVLLHENTKSSDPIEVILNAYHANGNTSKHDKEFHLIFKPYRIDAKKFVNTGLIMAHNTFSLITSSNLSFLIDENDKDIAQIIKFELVDESQFGVIQKMRLIPNNWVNVSQFTQRQVDRFKIRYLHLYGSPISDELQLRVLFNKQLIHAIQFQINFVKHLEIVSFGSNVYNFSRNEKEFIITRTEISFQTKPVLSDPQSILITLQSVPSYGILYLLATNTLQKKLEIASHFTQKDIDERRILYVRNNSLINIDSNRDLVDSFNFNVMLKNYNFTETSTFRIHSDDSLENYILINRKLTVLEGDKSMIDENHLFLRLLEPARNDVVLEIIKHPKFGSIQIIFDDGHMETNPDKITQKLIQQKKVFYQHDDSENNIDFFDFSIRNFSDNGIISAKFTIEILMKNDNPPIKKIHKKLNIIKNTEKILSNKDICYVDYDLNTLPSNIVYSKIHSSIGSFHFLNNTLVQTFTQQDVDDGLLKFQHNGADSGMAFFSVTDGQFNLLSESLEIKASEPYITIKNNTGVIVKYGETCMITSQNLTIETNLPDKNQIFIKLITEPKLGQILINEKSTNHFTLKELEDDFVEYESTIFEDESPFSKNDSFEFRVFSNDHQHKNLVTKSQEFSIRIYPLSYFNLNIVNLNNLTLFEESQALIDAKILLIEHSELKPNDIVYTITKKPRSGVIKNLLMLENSLQEEAVIARFSQHDINNGLILYQNIKSNLNRNDYSVDYLHDWFIFEVGNEIFKLTNLIFNIELIPKVITLSTENLTVYEGNLSVLTRKHIHLTHPYYTKYVDEFIVVEEPKYGTISLIGPDNIKLSAKSFTEQQLDAGKICYQHDSSEFERDWFTIVARANSIEKESLPATIHITVTSINDEAPVIINVSEIETWKHGMVQITNASLAATDADSKSNEIVYLISMPINGYLINKETNTTVDKFTQADINGGKIYFVHIGIGNGSFRFHLTDGKNYGISNIFRIKIRSKKIMIDINQKMLVTPGTQQSITNRHLQVSSSELKDVEREFLYRIIKTPTYGRIILEGFKQEEEISNFTQQQLNENLVLYDQNVAINEPIVLDRIIFNIESANMPTLKSVHFLIEISMENIKDMETRTDSLIPIEPLTVIEGKFSPISFKEMDLKEFLLKLKYKEHKVLFKISRQPIHGIILRNGLILDNFTLFPTTAICNHSIVYMHDDSNSYTDNIVFSIFTNDNFLISIMNLTLPIRIIPINDEYPIVVNKNPTLKANFASKTLITREILNTRDNDGNDTKIIYLFHNDGNISKQGFLSKKAFPKEFPIFTFTQQDINDNKIYFVHRGLKTTRLLFWFRVKDDESIICPKEDVPSEINYEHLTFVTKVNSHCTSYYPFSVTVIQFSIQLINQTSIQLYQGSWRTQITNSNLAAKSDNDDDLINIIYQIKKGPFNGHILVENKRSPYFNQKQINENQVYYVQENMLSEDSFMVDIFQRDNQRILNSVNIKIIVVPLVRAKKPFLTAFPGQKSLISVDHIDASELSLKSDSNPKFKILKNPIYGTLNLLSFGGENNLAESINEFTQNDIIQNRIIYLAYSNIEATYPNEIIIDTVEYELSASNVQNAHGVLVINIFNNQTMDELNNILIKNNYLSHLGMTLLKEQFFLFFFLILFLLLLIPTILIVVRMCLLSWPKSSKCPKNYVAQTLTTCNMDHSSVTSSRPNDTLSHYSSSTTFDHSVIHSSNLSHKSPFEKFENINLKVLKEHSKPFTREEMSPLPPPSLYFINDQSFDNHWDKLASTLDGLDDDDNKKYLTEVNKDVLRRKNRPTVVATDENDDDNDNDNSNNNNNNDNFNLNFSARSHFEKNPPYSTPINDNGENVLSSKQIIHDYQSSYGTLENRNIKSDTINFNSKNFKNQYWI